jgi:hypothetical protein
MGEAEGPEEGHDRRRVGAVRIAIGAVIYDTSTRRFYTPEA